MPFEVVALNNIYYPEISILIASDDFGEAFSKLQSFEVMKRKCLVEVLMTLTSFSLHFPPAA